LVSTKQDLRDVTPSSRDDPVPSQHQTASTQDAERIREHIRKILQKLSERRHLKAS